MELHNWTPDGYQDGFNGGIYDGVQTCVQNFKCRNCGAKGVRPDGQGLPDLNNCSGLVARPNVVRTNPFEGRDDEKEPSVKNTKHYQRKGR